MVRLVEVEENIESCETYICFVKKGTGCSQKKGGEIIEKNKDVRND